MSQFGMQMPGQAARRATMNVYTGLLFAACLALAAAVVYLYAFAMPTVGKDGDPFGMQQAGSIQLQGLDAAPAAGPRPRPGRPAGG